MTTDRERWLEARRDYLGASDAPKLFGHFGSPFSLYAEKLGLMAPTKASESMLWGNKLEAIVRDHYQETTGRTTQSFWSGPEDLVAVRDLLLNCSIAYGPDGEGRVILASDGRSWQSFSPDGFVYCEDRKSWGVLQIKCSSRRGDWDDGVPEYYKPQLDHELAVSGLSFASFGVLFNGNRFAWLDYDRDDERIDKLIEVESKFWQDLIDGTPPPSDDSDATMQALKAIYRHDDGSSVPLPPEASKWDEDWVVANAERQAAEAKRDAAETRFRAAIGDATYGVLPNGQRFSLKTTTHSTVRVTMRDDEARAVAAILADHPDLVFTASKLKEAADNGPAQFRVLRRLKSKG